jgi:hypothetical protein
MTDETIEQKMESIRADSIAFFDYVETKLDQIEFELNNTETGMKEMDSQLRDALLHT